MVLRFCIWIAVEFLWYVRPLSFPMNSNLGSSFFYIWGNSTVQAVASPTLSLWLADAVVLHLWKWAPPGRLSAYTYCRRWLLHGCRVIVESGRCWITSKLRLQLCRGNRRWKISRMIYILQLSYRCVPRYRHNLTAESGIIYDVSRRILGRKFGGLQQRGMAKFTKRQPQYRVTVPTTHT